MMTNCNFILCSIPTNRFGNTESVLMKASFPYSGFLDVAAPAFCCKDFKECTDVEKANCGVELPSEMRMQIRLDQKN